jgi:O-antigen/teichoic acid export membrane protein
MKLRRNLVAGFANSVSSAVIGIAVVPLYLKYLGIEAYGLIGFFVTTQALLQLLDMGMAPTINREVARCSAAGDSKEAGRLLHTLAVVYWGTAGVIAASLVLLSPFIAAHWLQSKSLPPTTIEHAVALMGVVAACRWPAGLYQGALIGAQRLVLVSAVSITITLLASLGAVAVLAFLSPTIEAFFLWQACAGLVYAIVMRAAAWRALGHMKNMRFDSKQFKRIWRFSAGMSAIGLSSLVFTQLDKVILSKIVSLEEFGHYMLATVVVSGLYVFITPVFNVVYPRLSAFVAVDDTKNLTTLYRLGTRVFASVLFPVAMVLAVFAEDVVHLWTGNPAIAASVAPVISLLAVGSALHGVMHFPYALQLAYGATVLPLTINAILMVVMVPLIVFLSLSYGAIGGATAWLVLHLSYLLLGAWLTHRHLLRGIALKWLAHDVGIAFTVSVLAGVTAQYAISDTDYSLIHKLTYGAMLGLSAILLCLLLSSEVRIKLLGGIIQKPCDKIN